jgi:hypothetical protein
MDGGLELVGRGGWVQKGVGIALLAFLYACDGAPRELESEDNARIVALGAPAAAALRQGLVARLTAAMEAGGPVGAIDFCSDEALSLTQEIQGTLQHGLTLKRTSFRYRNPVNAPDETDEAALLSFERMLESMPDEPPPNVICWVSDEEARYYEPLFVAEPCLQCHGSLDRMDPQVKATLADRYPADLATGYAIGDFRGLIRVSIPVGAIEE